jgi:hypothetical protein
MRRTYSQIKPRINTFVTVVNTAWLYPQADITATLATTAYKYTYDGSLITCPTLSDIIGVYSDIYNKTTISQPIGNVGYSIGVGTLLEDMGNEIRFCLTGGQVVLIWSLVKQLTPQKPLLIIPDGGNSPNNTIGYITTFCSYGSGANGGYSVGLDDVMVVRTG